MIKVNSFFRSNYELFGTVGHAVDETRFLNFPNTPDLIKLAYSLYLNKRLELSVYLWFNRFLNNISIYLQKIQLSNIFNVFYQ